MLTSRGRFGEKWVVHVTKLVGPRIPVYGVVGFSDPDGLLNGAAPLPISVVSTLIGILPINDVIMLHRVVHYG